MSRQEVRSAEPARTNATPRRTLREVSFGTEALKKLVEAELRAVEAVIAQGLASDVPLVDEVGRHLATAKGKRLRPMLLLLVSKLGNAERKSAILSGGVVELVHTATLVHDDQVDRSTVRRGRPTVNAEWDDQTAVIMGDYVFTKAFAMLAEQGLTEILDVLVRTTWRMCRGEMRQIADRRRADLTEEEYLLQINEKTASLIGAACEVGARLAGLSPEARAELAEFGEKAGLAFQLVDDVFDLVGNEAVLGKPVGSDFRAGRVTLPVIHSLRQAPPEERGFVIKSIAYPELVDGSWPRVLDFVERHGGVEYALGRADEYLREAKAILAGFGEGPVVHALDGVIDYVLARER